VAVEDVVHHTGNLDQQRRMLSLIGCTVFCHLVQQRVKVAVLFSQTLLGDLPRCSTLSLPVEPPLHYSVDHGRPRSQVPGGSLLSALAPRLDLFLGPAVSLDQLIDQCLLAHTSRCPRVCARLEPYVDVLGLFSLLSLLSLLS